MNNDVLRETAIDNEGGDMGEDQWYLSDLVRQTELSEGIQLKLYSNFTITKYMYNSSGKSGHW